MPLHSLAGAPAGIPPPLSLLEAGLSRQTIRVRTRVIRVSCNFLVREGLVAESPMLGVEIPRVPSTMPEVLSTEEIQKLLSATKGRSWHAKQNRATLVVFLDAGLRLSELIDLDVNDVDLGGSVIRER